jgi:hypothetical protein
METMILVPGPQGSRLTWKKEKIWEPTVEEMIVGYDRMDQLLDPKNVEATEIVDKITCFEGVYYGVYQQLQDDLQDIADRSKPKKRALNFPYDWRIDLLDTAKTLASFIAGCVDNGSNSITLVCHSGGNLVARVLLESGKYKTDNITKYVGICGPHFGVPRILTYALGLQGSMGISPCDMRKGATNQNFPSCYQFLPFDGYQGVLWDYRQKPPVAIDFYTQPTNPRLDPTNLGKAIDLQNAFKNKPSTVQYSLIAGTGHLTDETIDYWNPDYHIDDGFDGDGMIPIQSSKHLPLPVFVTPGDHIGIFKTHAFRSKLYEILTDGTLKPKLSRDDGTGASLSLNDVVFSPGETMQLLIILDSTTTADAMSVSLEITRRDEKLKSFERYPSPSLDLKGQGIGLFSAQIKAPEEPGAYLINLKGSHSTTAKTSAGFVVQKSADLKRSDRLR